MSIKILIETKEKKKTLLDFSILDAMQMLDVAWGKVTTKTAVKKLDFQKKSNLKSCWCWRSL